MILLLESVHPDAHEVLAAADRVELVPDLDAFVPGEYDDVRAIVTRGRGRVTSDVVSAYPELAVVARCGAGLDNIDTEAAAAADVAVVHAPGVTTHAVAEHALLLMLAVGRRLTEVDREVKAGNWAVREGFMSIELRGKRLGIVGFGAIGARIADFGRALGMDVVCSTRRRDGLGVPRLELAELLATSDVVQICVPLTDSTRGLFGAAQFAQMRPSAILINTARGAVVDHGALADALESEALGGYGADVWDPEPPAAGDRVLAHAATVISPHVAGLTDVSYREICVRPARAVVEVLRGGSPDPACVFGGR